LFFPGFDIFGEEKRPESEAGSHSSKSFELLKMPGTENSGNEKSGIDKTGSGRTSGGNGSGHTSGDDLVIILFKLVM
jgi:hypothetical protein